jgi:hypothetical protein
MEGKILGLEGAPGEEIAVIELAAGKERRIPLADVKEARLAFHW